MIETVGLIGAGSVGGALLSCLYKSYGPKLYLLAKGERAARIAENGVIVNDEVLRPQILSDAEMSVRLDLVILTVKTYSLDSAIEDIRDLIQPETILLPLENGITATDRLKEAFPGNRVLYGVEIRTDAHRMGHRIYFSVPGEVQIGYADNRIVAPEVRDVCDFLRAAGIDANIYEDMRRVQWRKWMLNTAGSQAAVEVGVECGFFSQIDEMVTLMRMCMDEILAIARAESVNLTEQDRDEILDFLLHYPANKKMSMLQDMEAGRPIELEEYAGTVVRLGKKHGIPTPANQVIYLTISARKKADELRKHMS